MDFKRIHLFFPFLRLFRFLIGMVIFIQLAIISYNHLSGYHELENIQAFLIRMGRGILLSLGAGFLIAYPDLYLIRHLNITAPWNKQLAKRLVIQLSSSVVIAVIVSVLITVFAHSINPYKEDFNGVLINNALIYSVVNIIVMSILEGWTYYFESRQARMETEKLQEELSQIRFEVLKSQINPHFMFNSLNVLSGLINVDVAKAQLFIDEFSQIYRYVLETIEQPISTLDKELEFMRSYLFLQQIRYGENLTYTVNVPAELLPMALPPLSLQILLENAIKHNIVNESKPLKIEIFSQENSLIVRNNIQPKVSGNSTGLGLKNLVKRYALISPLEPKFRIVDNHYVARIPLIKIEQA